MAFVRERRCASGRGVLRLGPWCFAFQRERRVGQVFPPFGLGQPFPVFFGVKVSLLAAEERIGATPLSVVHDFLPLTSGV